MKPSIRSHMLTRIFLGATFGLALLASPASAQKPGGSITVGLEVDIPGFDPLKVGVFDTAAETAAAAIFDTMTYLDDKGVAQPRMARRSMPRRLKLTSTGRRIRPTSADAPSISPSSMTCRRPTN